MRAPFPSTKLLRSASGQNTFEYLLVVGGVVVLMAIAWLGFDGLIPGLVGHVCPSVDTANPAAAIGSCLNP